MRANNLGGGERIRKFQKAGMPAVACGCLEITWRVPEIMQVMRLYLLLLISRSWNRSIVGSDLGYCEDQSEGFYFDFLKEMQTTSDGLLTTMDLEKWACRLLRGL
jgi:hypothetical protein